MNPIVRALAAIAVRSGTEKAEQARSGWLRAGKGKPGEFTGAASQCQHSVSKMRRPERHVSKLINSSYSYPERGAYWQDMARRGWLIGD